MGVWQLTFAGEPAWLKHEQGILHTAYLLYHPAESIHGVDLAARSYGCNAAPCPISSMPVADSNSPMLMERHARIQERSLALDDGRMVQIVRRREQELHAILEDDGEIEPVKAEALRELELLAEHQRKHGRRSEDNAQRAVRAVRRALVRFHAHLCHSMDQNGEPHPVLRTFAEHLERHLLIPSSRFGGYPYARSRAGVAGCFVYEPPTAICWR